MATFEWKPGDGRLMLPSRPHLDHLRKQAKTRLGEMRAAQPDARLADAQRALAQDYGFSSWSLLRQEVSRRTGTPHAPARRRARLGYGAHEQNNALLEQAAQAESHMAFFLSAGGTNIGVMFVIVAIVMSLWVLTSALHSL